MILTSKQYAEQGGCPQCGSEDLEYYVLEFETMDAATAGDPFCPVMCNQCNATWRVRYVSCGYSDLEDKDGNYLDPPEEEPAEFLQGFVAAFASRTDPVPQAVQPVVDKAHDVMRSVVAVVAEIREIRERYRRENQA